MLRTGAKSHFSEKNILGLEALNTLQTGAKIHFSEKDILGLGAL